MDEHREEREELDAIEREADDQPTADEWMRYHDLSWFEFVMLESERLR